MRKSYIAKAVREKVAKQANYRCGYCLTQQKLATTPLEIEHIIPEAVGGTTNETNLWLACTSCNKHKGKQTAASDPLTNKIVLLFNPRQQVWQEHFVWSEDNALITGITETGRATVEAIKLNRPELIQNRRQWITVGWHPPKN